MSNSISLAIVDDDQLILSLLRDYLDNLPNMSVIFSADNGEELLEWLSSENTPPDILILDLKMKGKSGIEITEEIKKTHSDIHVIIVSSHYSESFMGFMLKTGVSGFLPKGISPQELAKVVEEVSTIGYYFRPEQMDALRTQIAPKAPKPSFTSQNTLSDRETDVLRLICFQKTAKEIGEELFINVRTVEGHKSSLFVKTGARNIAGLVIYAIQNNIITPEEIPLI